MIKTIVIMDCDGVVFNSNYLKTKAFEQVLKERGYNVGIIEKFITYHKSCGGISRYKKFRDFICDFLNIDYNYVLHKELVDSYAQKCLDLYKDSSFTTGLINFLNCHNSIKYIASGSDENELQHVFKIRKIDSFFASIFGSPKTKETIVNNIVSIYDRGCYNIIMIGDSMEDVVVSEMFELKTYFMNQYSEDKIRVLNYCKKNNIDVINNLTDLC